MRCWGRLLFGNEIASAAYFIIAAIAAIFLNNFCAADDGVAVGAVAVLEIVDYCLDVL